MANELAHNKMCTLWEEAVASTDMKMTVSKGLDTYNMSGEAELGRASDSSDNSNDAGSDREYIPQDYRFNVQEGIVSSDADFQDVVERMVPVNRGQARRALARISAKDLRDPTIRKRVADGFARDLANSVDSFCYQRMMNHATMAITSDSPFSYGLATDAEVEMLNYGLGGYDKKLLLSNTDYARVAKDLGQNQYYGPNGTPANALEKASIPNLATFDTMRSDYLINLAGNSATGLTVNGEQSHTVATYDDAGFYLDNRFMNLSVTGATPTTLPVGTKFTIAGVNFIHPETRQDTGKLLTLTVVGAGTGSVSVSPAIVTDGPYRNASAPAAAGAAITILNTTTSAPSLFYTPESTVLIPGRLPIPSDSGAVTSVEASTEQGLPMRMSYTYDFHTEMFEMKGLVFFDCQVVLPNQVGAILSNQA